MFMVMCDIGTPAPILRNGGSGYQKGQLTGLYSLSITRIKEN